MAKQKSTKQVRAIDSIIKFQKDDGIESLTISGKDILADLEIDKNNNVTLYLNADAEKINTIKSLVPFINIKEISRGADPNKLKEIELSQDLTNFALELDESAIEIASIIKEKSKITLDLSLLVTKLLEISSLIAEHENFLKNDLIPKEVYTAEPYEEYFSRFNGNINVAYDGNKANTTLQIFEGGMKFFNGSLTVTDKVHSLHVSVPIVIIDEKIESLNSHKDSFNSIIFREVIDSKLVDIDVTYLTPTEFEKDISVKISGFKFNRETLWGYQAAN